MLQLKKARSAPENIYEIFSDMALLMLAAFVFIFVMILITSQLQGAGSANVNQQALQQMAAERDAAKEDVVRLQSALATMDGGDMEQQAERVLASAGLSEGKGKRDFDMFIAGLKDLPGNDLHMIVDATGSMHGVTTFLIPVLRLIAIRSGKRLSAVSWFADSKTGTFTGSMGAMLDQLMKDAPFIGEYETIGHALVDVAKGSPTPGAYLLIGDEPPTDRIKYHDIPAPVFTLPLGTSSSSTKVAYQRIADNTQGRMLELKFQ